MVILDPIYHPNVRNHGRHCCCWGLPDDWQPSTLLTDCIKAVINTIDNPDLGDHADRNIADEYRYNYEKFYEKALEYTLKYGRPRS